MKALTIRQPWASLIGHGIKTIETRSWSTKHRGTIAIHAGTVVPADGLSVGRWSVYRQVDGVRALDSTGTWRLLPLGAVVATATLLDCVPVIKRDAYPSSHSVPSYVVEEDHEGDLPHQQGGLWLIGDNDLTQGRPTRIEGQRPFGDFTPGRYAWLLTEIERLDQPVLAKGKQGLWEWTP